MPDKIINKNNHLNIFPRDRSGVDCTKIVRFSSLMHQILALPPQHDATSHPPRSAQPLLATLLAMEVT